MNTVLERIRTFAGLSEQAKPWIPILIGVFLVALAARAAVLILFLETDTGFLKDNDSHGYINLADNLQAGNGFAWEVGMPFTPDSFRTPGYPMFLEAHIKIFGSFIPALVTQIFLSLLIAWIVVLIADRYYKPGLGVIAAGVFLFMPFSLLVTERYLTQITFTAVVMLATWFWLEYLSKGYAKYLVLTALLIPLAALIRPIGIYFTVPFVASLGVMWLIKRISWKKFLGASAILVAVFLLCIAPWVIRNYRVFGLPYLSSITAVQLYFYDAPAIYAETHHMSYEEARTAMNTHIAEVTGYTVADNPILYTELSPLTKIMKQEGFKFVFENPVALVKTRAVQFFAFFTRDGIRYWIEHYGIDTYHGWALIPIIAERAVLLLFAIGFFFHAFTALLKKNMNSIALVLVVMYFAILSGVMSSAGLRFPAEALILLLGTVGLSELYTLIRSRIHI